MEQYYQWINGRMTDKPRQSEINPSIQRLIKRKEKWLDKVCRTIWTATNKLNQTYMFGSFCKNGENTIVTIGYFHPAILSFIATR